MTYTGNVFQLLPDGTLDERAVGVSGALFWVAPQSEGPMGSLAFVPNAQDGSLPRVEGNYLVEAAPAYDPRGTPVLIGRGTWPGALLRICTFELRFDNDPEHTSYFGQIHNGWAGAEVVTGPFRQVGLRNSADQYQLVTLLEGKPVIIADRYHRYLRIVLEKGELHGGPPAIEELGQVLVDRLFVDPRGPSDSKIRWTWYTLDRLGLAKMWPAKLQNILDEANRRASYRQRERRP